MSIKIALLGTLFLFTGCAYVGVHGGFSTGYYRGYYTPYPYSGYYSGSIIYSPPPIYFGRPRPSIRPFRPGRRPAVPFRPNSPKNLPFKPKSSPYKRSPGRPRR